MNYFYFILFFVISVFYQTNSEVEKRAAIDIGSGGTKSSDCMMLTLKQIKLSR